MYGSGQHSRLRNSSLCSGQAGSWNTGASSPQIHASKQLMGVCCLALAVISCMSHRGLRLYMFTDLPGLLVLMILAPWAITHKKSVTESVSA